MMPLLDFVRLLAVLLPVKRLEVSQVAGTPFGLGVFMVDLLIARRNTAVGS